MSEHTPDSNQHPQANPAGQYPQHNAQQNPPSGPAGQWYPTNPPAPPLAPTKQKSWFRRHKILTALLVFLALGVLGKAVGGGDSATTASGDASSSTSTADSGSSSAPTTAAPSKAAPTTAAPTKAAEPKTPGVGAKVRDGKFEFVVTGVEDGGTQIGDSTFGEKAQGKFRLVKVTVTNIGDEPQTMFDSNQKVTDAKGRSFAPSSSAAIYLPENENIWLKEINPGNTLQGTLVYDMPADSEPVSVELHDSMFSDGVKVALK